MIRRQRVLEAHGFVPGRTEVGRRKTSGDGPQEQPRVDLTGLETRRMHVEDADRGLREDEIVFVTFESVPDEADSRRARARNRLSDA